MKRGFTLIELLVVVLIIGILSAIALPQYQLAVAKARVMPLVSVLRSIDSAQQVYKLANGEYATDLSALDVQLPEGANSWQFIDNGKAKSLYISAAKSGVSFEKYYDLTYFYCWANKNNSLAVKLCQNLAGTKDPTGGGEDLFSYAF